MDKWANGNCYYRDDIFINKDDDGDDDVWQGGEGELEDGEKEQTISFTDALFASPLFSFLSFAVIVVLFFPCLS